jgi:glycosyltransferase involved in cell wall biosynthesis
MIDKVKISIVTVCYNDLEGLRRTSESVLAQSVPLEWIIVDADSGRATRELLASFTSEIHNIRWVSEKDKGLYDGMNKGFAMSNGLILCFLNSGDAFADKDTVSRVIESWIKSEWSWATGLAVRFNNELSPVSVWEYLDPQLSNLALGTRTFCHQATFYTKSILERVGKYEIDNLAADHLLNLRCFKIARPEIIPHVLTFFYDGGISSKRPFGAAMKDLRRVRIEADLLLMNSKTLDIIISKVVVILINSGGFFWRTLKVLSRNLLSESQQPSNIQKLSK